VVEILSPSTRAYDQGRKLALYSAGGVREYWIVDPESKSVQIWDFRARSPEQTTFAEGLLRSNVLPDVDIDVGELFGNLPEFPEADDVE
jgi:Uma2 family endonuclease